MAEDSAQRLQNDLNAVMEKVYLCREIMLVSPGIQEDETLAGVVGFLEACRDRMGELIEAGTQGLLGEELFEKTLSVNDAVNRTLDAERNGTKIDVKEEEEGASKEKGEEKSLLDLDDGAAIAAGDSASSKPSAAPASNVPVTKPKADDSLLAPYVAPAAAPSSSAAEADPFGADFETKPLDLPAPAPMPMSPNLPQAQMVPTPPIALDVQTTVMTPSVKSTTAEAPPRDNPQAAAEDFDAFLASLDK